MYSIQKLVDIPRLRALFEEFSRSTGFTTGLVSYPEQELLIATGWRDICVKFHRACPKAAECCKESNIHLTACLKELKELNIKPCGNGLVDAATPIIIRGMHLASLATGQILLAPPDLAFHRNLAKEYGYDEEAYLAALAKVPVVSEEQLKGVLKFLSGMAVQMGEEGLRSLQLQETGDVLRENAEKHKVILDTAMDGYWMNDMDGRLLEVNEAYCRMSGYSAQELLTMCVADLEVNETAEDIAEIIQKLTVIGELRFETRHRRKDGSIYDIEASIQYRPTDKTIVAFFHDITKRREAEEAMRKSLRESQEVEMALQKSEENLSITLESIGDGVIATDSDGRITRMNPVAERLTGWLLEEAAGRPMVEVFQIVNAYTREPVLDPVQKVLDHGKIVGLANHTVLLARDGHEYQIADSAAPIRNRAGQIVGVVLVFSDVTEIYQVQEAIRHSEALLGSVLNSSLSGIMVFKSCRNAQGAIEDFEWQLANAAAEKMVGRLQEDLLGKKLLEEMPGNRVDGLFDLYVKVVETGIPLNHEHYYEHEQVRTWFQTTAVKLGDGFVVTFTNITARKRAEEAERVLHEINLREKERLSVLLNSITDEIWFADLDGKFTLVNPEGRRAFALDAEGPVDISKLALSLEVLRSDGTLRPLEEAPPLRALKGEVVLGQEEIVRIPATDELRYRQVSSAPVKDAAGRIFGAVSVVHDITERKRAEETMRLQSGALEASANAVVITNREGVIEWANAAFTTLTGYSVAEVIGNKLSILKSGKQDRAFYQNLWTTILAGKVWHDVIINRRKDGSLYTVESTITPMKDSQGEITHFISVKQDITERKQLEEQLLRSARTESLGTLASGVAHDLNNILTPIILSAEMLRSSEEPEAREGLISSIEHCAQRGAAVVDQVLTFVRGTKGERTTLELNGIVRDFEKLLKETFPKNIAITSDIPSDLWPIKGDSTQLHQVLLNLCINARDAMPEGGSILITGENVEIDEHFATMTLSAKVGDYVVLTIADSGIGIPPSVINKIFEPFFTTKEVGKGTGLGLSTTIGIVRSHGGFITVNSEPGHGSAFKVFLPRKTEEEAVEQRHVTNMEFQPGNGKTILVVEDEETIARAATMVLEKSGYKVLTAANGVEGLALYEKHANEIDIVITDIMMPEMDGLQLSRSLKKINPQVNIVASTGQATGTQQAELHALGIHVILRKPYVAKQLLAALYDTIHSVG